MHIKGAREECEALRGAAAGARDEPLRARRWREHTAGGPRDARARRYPTLDEPHLAPRTPRPQSARTQAKSSPVLMLTV